ncbi:MAG: 7-cyano-7-deazaguanine synthase QueC [Eubacteriales bacterium]
MRTLVLLSGGLDSSVLLHSLVTKHGSKNVIALNMYYGQRHKKEIESARWQAAKHNVPLFEEDLSEVFKFNRDFSALLEDSAKEIEHISYAEQTAKLGEHEAVSAYVPYRNGLFLSYAASVAMQLDCDSVAYGAHADDAAGRAYPDCSLEFVEAQDTAIREGTAGKVSLYTPFIELAKMDIVSQGLMYGMTHEELEHTWSCYEGKEEPCGTCGTCRDRKVAFDANGIYDIK